MKKRKIISDTLSTFGISEVAMNSLDAVLRAEHTVTKPIRDVI